MRAYCCRLSWGILLDGARWQGVKEVFSAALEKYAAERAAWLR